MLQSQRNYIYKNKQLFESESRSKEDDNLPCFEIDFSKNYGKNKRDLEKIFPHGTSGIWIIEDVKDNIKKNEVFNTYEVAQTSDILSECIKDLQWLFLGKRDSRKNIYKNYTRKVYTRYKYQQIYLIASRKTKSNHPVKLLFRQIVIDNDRESRLKKEICIAIKREAIFWSPDPNQNKMIYNVLKGSNLEEEFESLESNRKYIPKKKVRRKKIWKKKRKST